MRTRTSLAFCVSTAKQILGLLFRLAVIVLVAWGVQRTLRAALNDLEQQGWSPADLHYGWLAAACMLYVFGLLPAGVYWHRVLRTLGVHTSLLRALGAYFIGHLGKYVPGKAMVVVLRAAMVRSRAGGMHAAGGNGPTLVETPRGAEQGTAASTSAAASVAERAAEPSDAQAAGAAGTDAVGPAAPGAQSEGERAVAPQLEPQERAADHVVTVSGLSGREVVARAAAAVFYETFGMMAAGCAIAVCCLLLVRPIRADLLGMAAAGALLLGLPTLPGVLRRVVPWVSVLGLRTEAAAWVASVPLRVAARGWVSMAGGWLLLGMSLWAVVRGVTDSVSVSWYEGWLASTATAALAMTAGFLSLLPAGLVVREAVVLVLLAPLVGERGALLAGVLSRVVSVVAELGISVILYPYAVDRDPRMQRSREP